MADTGNGIDLFFGHLVMFLTELERRNLDGLQRCTSSFCEYAVRQTGVYATHVYRLLVVAERAFVDSDAQAVHDLKSRMEELLLQLRELQGKWENELELRRLPASDRRVADGRPQRVHHGIGRPFVDISEQQLYALQSFGFSWTDVARILGMCGTCNHAPGYHASTAKCLYTCTYNYTANFCCLIKVCLLHFRSQ